MKTIFNTITFILSVPFIALFLLSMVIIGLIDNEWCVRFIYLITKGGLDRVKSGTGINK